MMKIQVREASMADIPGLVDMKIAMFAEGGRASLLPGNARHRIIADYQLLYGDGVARHFVADEDGAIVATVGAFLKDDIPYRYFEPSRYGFLGDVYTKPIYRNRGLAARLNAHALDWLRRQRVVTVRLLASDAGRPMYEKLGFVPTDEMVLHLTNLG